MGELIKLSIICTTYNHEKYLPYALQGIINQKTSFKFEVLIGEDCSTDNSREVIKQYVSEYPQIFKAYYHNPNRGAAYNFKFLFERAVGEYIIILETDDFWIDNCKLQRQVDFLDSHPDFIEVSHHCIIVDKDNNPIGIRYPECMKSEYTLKEFRKGLFPGQTASRMFRNYYKYSVGYSTSIVTDDKYGGPGDIRRAFMNAANSRVACLPFYMSAYRLVYSEGSSYTASNKNKSLLQNLNYKKNIVEYAINDVKTKDSIYSAEYLYTRDVLVACLKKQLDFSFVKREIKKLNFKKRVLFHVFLYIIKIIILKPFGLNKTYLPSDRASEIAILKKYFNDNFNMILK